VLSREEMLARMLGSDPTADGVFVVAVRTTGIYCLPSCRPSRKPKPENVIFYETPAEARRAGFRACKLCKPEDFYNGHHAEEALIEGLVARVARDPGAYRSTGALATAIGVGASKLHELVRAHYHTTPATLLNRARVAAAQAALLAGSSQVAEIAFAVGFESLSTFNDNFRRYAALTPLDYRRLREQSAFTLTLPQNYPTDRIVRYLGRDRQSVTERVAGQVYTTVLRVDDKVSRCAAVPVTVSFAPGVAHCRIAGACALDTAGRAQVHGLLLRILGLTNDPARFEAQIADVADLAPLLVGQQGLRVPLIADPFDALVWAITGQQITLAFAYALRRRLIERIGDAVYDGLHTPPRIDRARLLAGQSRLPPRMRPCGRRQTATADGARRQVRHADRTGAARHARHRPLVGALPPDAPLWFPRLCPGGRLRADCGPSALLRARRAAHQGGNPAADGTLQSVPQPRHLPLLATARHGGLSAPSHNARFLTIQHTDHRCRRFAAPLSSPRIGEPAPRKRSQRIAPDESGRTCVRPLPY